MTDTECIHGLDPTWCAHCKPAPKPTTLRELFDAGDYAIEREYHQPDTGWLISKIHIGGKIAWAAHDVADVKLYRTLRAAKNAYIKQAAKNASAA